MESELGKKSDNERDEAQLKAQVQAQFGASASNYVSSAVHAKGWSLERLVELVEPQSDWRVLDVATGGGHTALTFAAHVRSVIALDLTNDMLVAARNHTSAEGAENVEFVAGGAGWLPFANGTFEIATCRIAPHHFPDVSRFVREMARVVRPGGLVAVTDNVTPADTAAAEYLNAFERLRDRSHNWAYSVDDWLLFFSDAGLMVTHHELQLKRMDFDGWVERMLVPEDNRVRLRVMLLQAPAAVRDWQQPRRIGARIEMNTPEVIIVGRRPESGGNDGIVKS